ncbi:MAG: SRPBCC domain-containing protein [Myxococcota bacterium]
MKQVHVRRTIHAPVTAVWAVLTDPQRLQTAPTGVTRIEGTIEKDARIKLWSEASPGRAFPLQVTELVPHRRMVWQGGMPLGLFKGVREFDLREQGASTDFSMTETFTGLMLPLIWKSMPDLQPSFETFADGLDAAVRGVDT